MEAAHLSARRAEPRVEQPIRAAELVGALSLATDLGTGQPLEHALRTAVLAVRLGELAGASPEELADTYYVALLHGSGCTSNSHEATQLFGEDIMHRAAFFLIDPADPEQVLAFYRAHVGPGRPTEVRERMIEAALANPDEGARVVRRDVRGGAALRRAGSARPGSRGGARVRLRALGRAGARRRTSAVRRSRCRRVFSTSRGTTRSSSPPPARTRRAPSSSVGPARRTTRVSPSSRVRHFDEVCAGLDDTRMWEHALESEPFPQVSLAGDRIDAGFAAIAALTGLKSPWLREHSTGVADLAEAAAWRLGLPAETVTLLRRAALAHDLGRVGVSNAIWEKPGPLGFGEWERVRLHPHFTERAFAQSPALAPIGLLAGSHHERLDGSGYHRGPRGSALDQAARILAAADCYTAMREARPYRPALEPAAAEAELKREVEEGRLDAEAVDAVLAAAGHRVSEAAAASCRPA